MKKKKFFKLMKEYSEQNLINASESLNYSEYDSDVSKKLYDLVLNIIKYKDSMNISYNSNKINISVPNIKDIKKVNSKVSRSVYNDDYYLDINIVKDKGFSISYSYKQRSNYNDKEMYNLLINIVSERLKEINSENFNDIWNSVVIESGLIRENNLEKLFDE